MYSITIPLMLLSSHSRIEVVFKVAWALKRNMEPGMRRNNVARVTAGGAVYRSRPISAAEL
jgi:hypothetical protein